MKRDQKNMTKLLVGVIVALVAVLAVLVVVLVLTPSATITSHSAQAEVEAEQKALKEAEKEGYYDTDIIEVVDLSALIGLDLTSALAEIGHGAEIDGDPKLVAAPWRRERFDRYRHGAHASLSRQGGRGGFRELPYQYQRSFLRHAAIRSHCERGASYRAFARGRGAYEHRARPGGRS